MTDIKVPRGEIAWTRYLNSKGEDKYILTSKSTRDYYYLYEIQLDGSLKKLGKGKTPREVEESFKLAKLLSK